MILSERLKNRGEPLWLEAAGKEFLVNMARGTLEKSLYKNYMIQDYLYLKDYIKILHRMLALAEDDKLKAFLEGIIRDTEYETWHVHVPGLRSLGIRDTDIEACKKGQVITDYIGYMLSSLKEYGILTGLTALLQCSWNYAYVAKAVSEKYEDELSGSAYKSWFEAYTADGYTASNQLWIDMLDERTRKISEEEADRLCAVFENCARYENRLWDYLARP